LPTWEDLLQSLICAQGSPSVTSAYAAHGAIAAYLVANGSQSWTNTATGATYVFETLGIFPGWVVKPTN
jgi:hypothetical protein